MKNLAIAVNGKEIQIANKDDAKHVMESIGKSVSAKEEWSDEFHLSDGNVFRVQLKHIAYIAWQESK